MQQCTKCRAILPGDPLQCPSCGSGELLPYTARHGGARPGAGRPPSGIRKVNIGSTVLPETAQYIRDIGDGSPSAGLEFLVNFHRECTR